MEGDEGYSEIEIADGMDVQDLIDQLDELDYEDLAAYWEVDAYEIEIGSP